MTLQLFDEAPFEGTEAAADDQVLQAALVLLCRHEPGSAARSASMAGVVAGSIL